VTDALAQWFLTQQEAGKKPWQVIDKLVAEPETENAFAPWVEHLRGHGSLRNDDVTRLTLMLKIGR
jgi:hypothetical protein